MERDYIESASMLFQAALPDISGIYGRVVTEENALDVMAHIIGVLPDPDPFLRKSGYSESVLDTIMGDARVTTVVLSRKENTIGLEWEIRPGVRPGREDDEPESDAVAMRDFLVEHMPTNDMPDIIGEILNAFFFGYVPVEIIYEPVDGRVAIVDLIPVDRKRIKWNTSGEPRFFPNFGGPIDGVPLPLGKFVFAQHYPEFKNPYGLRLGSRCYWPVFFKKAGWKFWAQLAESHGSPKVFAALKSADWSNKETRRDTLASLKGMIQNTVAVGPEDTKLEVVNPGATNAAAYDLWIKALNHEITLAIQGESLTTEAGDRGARSLGEVEQQTSENRAVADRRIVKQTIDRSLLYATLINSPDVPPPTFHYIEKEDLKDERADRDGKLRRIGWRPTRKYIVNNYAMEDDDFELDSERDPDDGGGPNDNNDPRVNRRGALFQGARRARQAANDAQDDVDFFVAEQIRAVSSITEQQVAAVVKYAFAARSWSEFEDNLATVVDGESDDYEAILEEIQVAANMYGRQSIQDE